VRRTREGVPGGPFRDAHHEGNVEIAYAGADDPRGSPLSPIVTVGGSILFVVALFAGVWDLAAAMASLVTIAIGEWITRRSRRGARLTITSDAVVMPGERPLALADVRRVAVERIADASAVRVETPDGVRIVAQARDAAHARFIADEIEGAYREHLRRR
jgi:hypothetical protein